MRCLVEPKNKISFIFEGKVQGQKEVRKFAIYFVYYYMRVKVYLYADFLLLFSTPPEIIDMGRIVLEGMEEGPSIDLLYFEIYVQKW